MTEAADPLAALRAILLNDPDVNTITGGRVRALALHQDDVDAMPLAAVSLKPAGGPGARGYQQFSHTRIDVTCYGSSLDESWDVWLTVKPVLHQLERTVAQSVLIHSATIESDGASGIDPFTQWPTTYSTWLVLAADVAAA